MFHRLVRWPVFSDVDGVMGKRFDPGPIRKLSIVSPARISNIAGLVSSIYERSGNPNHKASEGLRTPLPPRLERSDSAAGSTQP